MKTRNSTLCSTFNNALVKRIYLFAAMIAGSIVTANTTQAQCAGLTSVNLRWDNLDYMPYNAAYQANAFLTSNAQARTQNFAFGANNRLTITHEYLDANSLGEDSAHTATIGSFANGFADLHFIGDQPAAGAGKAITLRFETPVTNLRFSMFDIDRGQRVQFNATNGGPGLPVTLGTVSGVLLSLTNNGTMNARADAAALSVANTSTDGTVNVTIAGPVLQVIINVTSTGTCSGAGCAVTGGTEDGSFWISDINACVTANFPTSYYAVSQPFSGQPGYFLHALDENVYYVNQANGYTRVLFSDPDGLNVNSMAYDPYGKILYYVNSLTGTESRYIKKYDFNTETGTTAASPLLANINTIGVPTSDQVGIESGAGAFYNGSYYIGVETGDGGARTSGREATIWRLDFTAGVPTRSSQVFAMPIDSAGFLMFDWSDFVIDNGILYNFDAAENDRTAIPVWNRNEGDIYQVNLNSGAFTRYRRPGFNGTTSIWMPGQPSIDWQGNVYQVYANPANPSNAGAQPKDNPYITTYNPATGLIDYAGKDFLFSSPAFTPAAPSVGDAAEAFRPKADFGDAPSTYDPVANKPALHEIDPRIKIGANIKKEWLLTSSALANAETGEEDGIGSPPNLNYNATLTYTVSNISVTNNTGTAATLVAWLDYNNNGVFEASEGRAVAVASAAGAQTKNITWSGIWVPSTVKVRTFLRLRLTTSTSSSSTVALTVNDMNGWAIDGEVEDFPVLMGTALPNDMQSFTVAKENNSNVNVKWSINVQQAVNSFEILRSSDNENWKNIGTVTATTGTGFQQYNFADGNPTAGTSYYRIKINYASVDANKYTDIKSIRIDVPAAMAKILPNPVVSSVAELRITAKQKSDATIVVFDPTGKVVMSFAKTVEAGENRIKLDNVAKMVSGMYTVQILLHNESITTRFVKK